MSTELDNQELLAIVNKLIVDRHISTECDNFVSTCYNLFYNTTQLDVTFTIGDASYTIPNMAKNTGVVPTEGVVDPEGVESGVVGKFYFNSTNRKVFFKATATEERAGWVMLFQYVASPNEDDTLDNLTQLLINSQNIISLYYTMFYDDTSQDVSIQLYDENGTLQTYTIPNRAKSLKSAITGTGSPEGVQVQGLGTIYVDTSVTTYTYTTIPIWIKTTPTGNLGWVRLLYSDALTEHNASSTAHAGYLARLNGSTSQTFNVGYPVSDTHAVNINYVGALSNLQTTNKSNIVGSINELYDMAVEATNIMETSASAQPWTIVNGNLDSSGEVDLILDSNDTDSYYYEDLTPLEYEDNTNNGSWVDNFGSLVNTYTWGNEGRVFGSMLGSAFNGWSKINSTPNTPQSDNIGYIGHPIIHGVKEGAGTYKLAIGSDSYNASMISLGTVLATALPTTGNGGTITVNADVRDILSAGYLIKIAETSAPTTINGTYKVQSMTYVAPTTADPVAKTIITLAVAGSDNINMPVAYTQATGENVILRYYTFRLFVIYDGSEHEIAVPDSISSTEWTNTSEFTVTTSITGLKACANANKGEWFIGAVHLIKVIPYATYHADLYKIYFKAGAGYKSVGYTDINNKLTSVPALASIDLSNKSEGTYKIFVNNSGYNKGAFTEVGSVNITQEGIASGFSASNYIETNLTFNPSLGWEVTTKITTGSDVTTVQYIEGCFYSNMGALFDIEGGLPKLLLSSSGSSTWDIGTVASQTSVIPNSTYWFKYGWDGNTYYIKRSTDGETYVSEATLDSATPIHSCKFYIGNGNDLSKPFLGSVDLSELDIKIEQPRSNYTVVGSPTISSNYVASGFSTSNYATFQTIQLGNYDSWEINIGFTTGSSVIATTQGLVNLSYNNYYSGVKINVRPNNNSLGISLASSTTEEADIVNYKDTTILTTNTSYILNLKFTGTAYIAKLYSDGVETTLFNQASTTKVGTGVSTCKVGQRATIEYFTGSIDLKQFSITVDGSEVYRAVPTDDVTILRGSDKLPYIIENNISYTKVAPTSPNKGDVWKNVAYAPMTVQQYNGTEWVDFKDNYLGIATLSSGIFAPFLSSVTSNRYNTRWVDTPSNTSPAYMTDSYNNTTDNYWYRKWSNGFVEQGGNNKAISTSASTIILPVALTSSTYSVTVSPVSGTATFNSQTTTTFTITGSASTTCSWVVRGF